MKLKNLEEVVECVLEKHEKARNDDFMLYGYVISKFGIDMHQELQRFLWEHEKQAVPSFESVSRCRRKIQERRQELQGFDMLVKRAEEREKYELYAKGGNV